MKRVSAIVLSVLLLSAASACASQSKPVAVPVSDGLLQDNSISESSDQESSKQESSKQESSKQESSKQESSKQESSKQESSKQESSKQESSKRESSKQESSKQESSKQESSKQESSKQESSKQESSKQESSKQESSKQESSKQESSEQESSKQESSKQESSKQESSKQESSRQDSSLHSQNQNTKKNRTNIPVIKNIRSRIDQIDIEWEPVNGVEGYCIQYSASKSFPSNSCKTVETKDNKITLKVLKKNQRYYFRVCCYKTSDSGQKSYTEWGSVYSENLKTIHEVNGVTYVDGILITNKTYSLPMDFGDGLSSETLDAFDKMSSDAASQGIYLYIISGFRSYWTQQYTYNSFIYDRGVEQADRCSARPGHSEHQTGLAIDVNTTSDYFAYTPEAEWLERNCVRYGFIIRYPKDKEDVTGYKYEPWHIRYLGVQKAAEIASSGLTIEEYYGLTSVYP